VSALLASTHAELIDARGDNRSLAVVMTMGALHAGHASLIRRAREVVGRTGYVVVTDFVNPTQFGGGEDFDRYPRTLEHDLEVSGVAGADVVFAPSVEEMYGSSNLADLGNQVMIEPGALGEILEGAARPGHFKGMLTIVGKLLHLTAPKYALYGEKDYQQLALITAMATQLRFPVEIIGVPTVREEDGLAMSSRNRFLSKTERAVAAVIPRAIQAAAEVAKYDGAIAGVRAGSAILADHAEIEVDYLVITNPQLGPAHQGEGRVLVAAQIGSTRLIDNISCEVGA
jgi:pantoate--beta-alanine ligase